MTELTVTRGLYGSFQQATLLRNRAMYGRARPPQAGLNSPIWGLETTNESPSHNPATDDQRGSTELCSAQFFPSIASQRAQPASVLDVRNHGEYRNSCGPGCRRCSQHAAWSGKRLSRSESDYASLC